MDFSGLLESLQNSRQYWSKTFLIFPKNIWSKNLPYLAHASGGLHFVLDSSVSSWIKWFISCWEKILLLQAGLISIWQIESIHFKETILSSFKIMIIFNNTSAEIKNKISNDHNFERSEDCATVFLIQMNGLY